MAFFKFRFPGKTGAAASEGLSAAPGQSLEVLRRRARHRLFGSVVLVFVAVVVFPLLFDSQPRPVAVDTPIVIPDRHKTAPLAADVAVPAAQAPAKPLLPAASAEVSPQASLESGKEERVAASARRASEAPSTPKPASPVAPLPKPSASALSNAQKAMSLLEGKGGPTDAAKVVVQVGAFADADRVREVRQKLEQAGIKTYIQNIEGKDGKRTTRVRAGPFETRAEAEKAAARIRKLDLQASVIAL